MSLRFLMPSLLVLCTSANAVDVPDGRWSGAILLPGIELETHVTFDAAQGTAHLDIPIQGAFGLPLKDVVLSEASVHFELVAGPGLAVFESDSVSKDRIEGSFVQGAAKGTFFLEPNPDTRPPVDHADETEVSVEVDGGELRGALAVPEGADAFDLVILHAGSGPTTRDGNSQSVAARNDSLLLLSDALVERGLAVLRFDKRGVGGSVSAVEGEMLFDSYIPDLLAWVEKMRADSRCHRILLAGHSEGALISTLAAQGGDVDGLVVLAGPGRPLGDVLLEQLGRSLPAAALEEAQSIVAGLLEGKPTDPTHAQLQSLFRPSVQPYLISLFKLDPAAEFGAVQVPALILQGTTDIQVSVEDAKALAAANPKAQFTLLEGMNHIFKTVPEDRAAQLASYGDPHLPLHEPLAESIATFVREQIPERKE